MQHRMSYDGYRCESVTRIAMALNRARISASAPTHSRLLLTARLRTDSGANAVSAASPQPSACSPRLPILLPTCALLRVVCQVGTQAFKAFARLVIESALYKGPDDPGDTTRAHLKGVGVQQHRLPVGQILVAHGCGPACEREGRAHHGGGGQPRPVIRHELCSHGQVAHPAAACVLGDRTDIRARCTTFNCRSADQAVPTVAPLVVVKGVKHHGGGRRHRKGKTAVRQGLSPLPPRL